MDIFEFFSEYKPERPLTKEQAEQNTNYLVNHPLFCEKIPQDVSQNEAFIALKSLQQPEDPNQQAQILNNQANKKLKQRPDGLYHMKQAYQKYTQAIKLKCSSAATNAKLHANRAQINLKLKNYGKVINDCKSCLQYDPNYTKGYYRYAKALIALSKYDECVKLLTSRTEPDLLELLNEAKTKNNKKIQTQQKQRQKKQQTQNQIKKYCDKKGWKYFKRDQPLPQGAKAKIIENKLSIPLVILYPQFNQFDLIMSTFQTDKVKQHIMQPIEAGLPWDLKHQYSLDSIQIFCEVSQAVIMKIPKQAKLQDVLSRVPFRQALELQIVRKDNNFYNSYMAQHKII